MTRVKLLLLFLAFFVTASLPALSQPPKKTISLTIDQADSIFLRKNLLLLAQHYEVNAVSAREIQAKLYDNPTFSTELSAYNPSKGWFDLGTNGQKAFAIDQLIYLAGKRNKRIALAKEDTKLASYQFEDLIRTLKYTLHSSYYTLQYNQEIIDQITSQLDLLGSITAAYDSQAQKRNLSEKDVARLQTEYIQLNAERNNLVTASLEAQNNLGILLDTSAIVTPPSGTIPSISSSNLPGMDSLLNHALNWRPDLKQQQTLAAQSKLYLNYQKALAVPDLKAGVGYDQNGSYVPHYYNLHLAIDLPFFNRNQGNIKSAEQQQQAIDYQLKARQQSIEWEITTALAQFYQFDRDYQEASRRFNKNFPLVNRGMIENFNKGNINILEFLDFFESYNSAIRQINQLGLNRAMAYEQLQFVTGIKL
ncbi:TolC family protein [Flavihumibacter rivuli]|uniref:TolC family protein n=1 Tax=Flavihumibacter rivuli TaxID=2838156 RepID=UPI001BDF5940|nr:TolC family protein [Flavihumibacter rivuli]ULQ56502.1 TolC family protein [Flavihumibacter rivuli]